MTPESSDGYYSYTPQEYEDRWLRFELVTDLDVSMELSLPIIDEAARIEPLLNRSAEWRAWWAATSKAPAVDLGISIAWPGKAWFPETVSRGRKQHHVRVHVDAGQVQQAAEADRPAMLLPALEEALRRLSEKLKLAPMPTRFPEGCAPLSRTDST